VHGYNYLIKVVGAVFSGATYVGAWLDCESEAEADTAPRYSVAPLLTVHLVDGCILHPAQARKLPSFEDRRRLDDIRVREPLAEI